MAYYKIMHRTNPVRLSYVDCSSDLKKKLPARHKVLLRTHDFNAIALQGFVLKQQSHSDHTCRNNSAEPHIKLILTDYYVQIMPPYFRFQNPPWLIRGDLDD